jgi:hypothetical protein
MRDCGSALIFEGGGAALALLVSGAPTRFSVESAFLGFTRAMMFVGPA